MREGWPANRFRDDLKRPQCVTESCVNINTSNPRRATSSKKRSGNGCGTELVISDILASRLNGVAGMSRGEVRRVAAAADLTPTSPRGGEPFLEAARFFSSRGRSSMNLLA